LRRGTIKRVSDGTARLGRETRDGGAIALVDIRCARRALLPGALLKWKVGAPTATTEARQGLTEMGRAPGTPLGGGDGDLELDEAGVCRTTSRSHNDANNVPKKAARCRTAPTVFVFVSFNFKGHGNTPPSRHLRRRRRRRHATRAYLFSGWMPFHMRGLGSSWSTPDVRRSLSLYVPLAA